jgi:hypothetical protein
VSDYAQFQVGNAVYPLTAATTNSLLQDADPAIFYTLQFVAGMIQLHLSARWDAEMTKADLSNYVGTSYVNHYTFDPTPFLTQNGVQPPFLALYTSDEEVKERTRAYYENKAHWKLLWVLPPMTTNQYNALYAFLRAASKVITDRLIQGYDPNFESGALFAVQGGIEQLDIGEITYGWISGPTTNLFFPSIQYEMTCMERRMPTPGLETLAGTDVTIQVQPDENSDPNTPITVVQIQTEGF